MNESCHNVVDYFNRCLTEDEMRQFESHLIECPSCQEELMELEMLTADLPYASEMIEVPTDLKARVFDSLPNETGQAENVASIATAVKKRRRVGPFTSLLAAALFASLVTNAFLLTEKTPEVAQNELQVLGQTILTSQTADMEVSAVAMLVKDGNQEVLLVDAENLPALTGDKLYQVWVLEGDQPYPAGVVQSTEAGKGSISHQLTDLSRTWDTVAITIEEEPNLAAPQGQLILAGGI